MQASGRFWAVSSGGDAQTGFASAPNVRKPVLRKQVFGGQASEREDPCALHPLAPHHKVWCLGPGFAVYCLFGPTQADFAVSGRL